MKLQCALFITIVIFSVVGCRSVPSTEVASGATDNDKSEERSSVDQYEVKRSVKPFDRSSLKIPFEFSSLEIGSTLTGLNTPSDVSSLKPDSNTPGLNSVINGFVLVGEVKSRDIDNQGSKHNLVEEFRYVYDYEKNTIETKYSLFRFETGPSGLDLIEYNENGWKIAQQSGEEDSLHVKTSITVDRGGEAVNEKKSLELAEKPSLVNDVLREFNDDGTLHSEQLVNYTEGGSVTFTGSKEYIYEAGRISSTRRTSSNNAVATNVYFYDDAGRVYFIVIDKDADYIADKGFVFFYNKDGNIHTLIEVDALGEIVSKVAYSYERSPEAVYNIPFRRLRYSYLLSR